MSGLHPEFKAFLGSKEIQAWLNTIPREKTRATYVSSLFRYWRDYGSKTYPTLWDWICAVRSAQRSDDNVMRKMWTFEVQNFMSSYRNKATGQELGFSRKGFLTAAVLKSSSSG